MEVINIKSKYGLSAKIIEFFEGNTFEKCECLRVGNNERGQLVIIVDYKEKDKNEAQN